MTSFTRIDGTTYEAEDNQNVVVHGVGADGAYLGLVAPEQAEHIAASPAPGVEWKWDVQLSRWIPIRDLALEKLAAYDTIDKTAGAARMRYITDVPGQAGTYLLKAEQARAYIEAQGIGPVPPYVQGEAEATGRTYLEAAQDIQTLAILWADQLGPAIEKQRRIGKINVENATTLAEADAALADCLSILSQI